MAACFDATIKTNQPTPIQMDALKQQIRELMVAELMLPMSPEEIATDTLIFSPQGLALDSVDALQLVVALEKKFGLKMADADAARSTLHSIDTIADAISTSAQM